MVANTVVATQIYLERFGDAMRRAQPSLATNDARERAEVLLATMNGLAFRSALDSAFDFASHVPAIRH
ncbi:MAG: hypothetical protein GY720_03050 [bacterium]|nr:hypothetical protein [bacterium]